MSRGNTYSDPRDANRVPVTTGVSTVDGITPVPLEVNPATGQLQVAGGGGGTQYTDGGTPPAHPVGGAIEWSDGTHWQTASTAEPLPVTPYDPGLVDATNSSTTPLTSNASFTGTDRQVTQYNYVQVLVNSDQPSATNGVQIQFSEDNTNWIDSSTWTYTPGTGVNAGQAFVAVIRGQYSRVVYTNTNHNQASFALQTIFMGGSMTGDVSPVGNAPNLNNHAQNVSAQIYGQSTAGGSVLVPVKVNPSGTLTTASNVSDTNGNPISAAARTDGINAMNVADDFGNFEAQNLTLTGSTDTTITFAETVRLVRIKNYDTANRILVKNSAIATNSDAASDYVGVAPTTNVPATDYFPYKTTTIHVRSAGASFLSVTGFY